MVMRRAAIVTPRHYILPHVQLVIVGTRRVAMGEAVEAIENRRVLTFESNGI
jgi:hypothetical protein